MKTILKRNIIVAMVLLYLGGLSSCKNEELEIYEYPEHTVTDFSPKSGRPGSLITITGTNFGTLPGAVSVEFNGLKVEVDSVSDTKLFVRVPGEATTGPLKVNVWTHSKVTKSNFEFIPGAKITGITPLEGEIGQQITIEGENFGTNPNDISVFFKDNIEAEVVSVEPSKIVVALPDGGITGPVTLVIGSQTVVGPVFSYPMIGLEFLFDADGDSEGWTSTHNSTFEVSGGSMNVTFDPAQFGGTTKRRADFQLQGGAEVHAGDFPILAIKLNKPSSGNFILDTDLGRYKDGSNNWEGILIGDVYYYDLRNSFGAGNTLSTTEPTQFSTFQFKIADITTDELGYSVDWVRSFENLDALKEFIALPEGKHIFEFDDPASTDWIPQQNASYVIENSHMKVTFDPVQFEGTNKRRADFRYMNPTWIYTSAYPILAVRLIAPPVSGNIRPDIRGATFGNNDYLEDFVSNNVIYWDLRDHGLTDSRIELDLFQIKIADITSDETGYDVDWVRTFASKEELAAFLGN